MPDQSIGRISSSLGGGIEGLEQAGAGGAHEKLGAALHLAQDVTWDWVPYLVIRDRYRNCPVGIKGPRISRPKGRRGCPDVAIRVSNISALVACHLDKKGGHPRRQSRR